MGGLSGGGSSKFHLFRFKTLAILFGFGNFDLFLFLYLASFLNGGLWLDNRGNFFARLQGFTVGVWQRGGVDFIGLIFLL